MNSWGKIDWYLLRYVAVLLDAITRVRREVMALRHRDNALVARGSDE
jgi:hypothetical protein